MDICDAMAARQEEQRQVLVVEKVTKKINKSKNLTLI